MSKAQEKSRDEIINTLVSRIDKFEKYSIPHSQSMSELATHLARRFGLAPADVEAIAEAARLHDIGLYAMSPAYHSSSHALRFEERLDLWRHPVIGQQELAKRDGSRHAQLLVRWHHEWWNGYGYPDMLAFEDIPIGARILRAVELYNALLSKRPYRAAYSKQEALDILKASAGLECDPYVVHALLALLNDLGELKEEEAEQPIAPVVPPVVENTDDQITQPVAESIEPHQAMTAETQPEPREEQVVFQPANQAFFNDQQPTQSLASSTETSVAPRESTALQGETPQQVFSDEVIKTTEPSPSSFQQSASAEPVTQTPPSVWQNTPPEPSQTSLQQEALQSPAQAPPAAEASQPRLSQLIANQPPPFIPPAIAPLEPQPPPVIEIDDSPTWLAWAGGSYNQKALLGFEVSVLRQFQFDSIALPFSGEAKLDWYLKLFRKRIASNDSRAWAAITARAMVESTDALTENHLNQLLHDIYIPGARLGNRDLLRWFRETDAWWLENLRRNIQTLDDEKLRAQAYFLGLQVGDYALSFNEETLDYRRPLATVFWRLAGRLNIGAYRHPQNRCFNLQPQEFIKQSQADLLYLDLPAARAEIAGSHARSEWRECWVTGDRPAASDATKTLSSLQSKQAYLLKVDEMFRAGAHIKRWAIGCQEIGLTSAREISELVKAHRAIRATYSKDVSEVAGGLRSYIIVAEKT